MCERILLVDDDPLFAKQLSQVLSRYGHIEIAKTAAEALAALARFGPMRAAVIDLCLPGGRSGFEVLDEMKRSHPGTPVLLISGNFDIHPVNAAYLAGVDYLEKPFGCECIERFMASSLPFSAKIAVVLRRWAGCYKLTAAQEDVLRRLAAGESQDAISLARSCAPATVKRHIFDLLQKTADESCHAAVERLFREAAGP